MKSLAVRLTLVGLLAIAIGAAGYLFWIGEAQARADAAAARSFDSAAVAAARIVLDLRSAQQGYVAAGQGDEFWAGKATEAIGRLREEVAALRARAAAAQSQTELDGLLVDLQDFEQLDRRAHDYARGGQKLLASDVVFSAGFDTTGEMLNSIDRVRDAERQARDEAARGIRRRQLYALGAAAAAAILTMLLLAPRAIVEKTAMAAAAPVHVPDQKDAPDIGLALDEGWSPPKKSAPGPAPAVVQPAKAAIDLERMASVCADLARVADTQALPKILERAGEVLDASGIVLWISDPDSRELSPIVTHGYTPQIVARLGTILRDAENATAAAFRTSLLQTVKADAVSHGAIAAPLVTPAGCVGVMAAEVRHEGEKDAARLAAATIVAAQLATLVGPPSSRAQAKIEAAGA